MQDFEKRGQTASRAQIKYFVNDSLYDGNQ